MSLSAAAVYGQREMQLDLVKLLLKAECNINVADKDGWTPLFHAAYAGEIGQQYNTLLYNMLHNITLIECLKIKYITV